jgi:hypothetical protein
MIIKKELICRQIAGDRFLVPVGKTVYDTNGLFVLTEVGAFIWDLLPSVNEERQIVDAILEEYDVNEQTAASDVSVFLQKLRELEII